MVDYLSVWISGLLILPEVHVVGSFVAGYVRESVDFE